MVFREDQVMEHRNRAVKRSLTWWNTGDETGLPVIWQPTIEMASGYC